MKKTKVMGLLLAGVLLVGATIMGTMAYLTDEEEVKNTFTVGNVDITLDEAKVDENGAKIEDADRVQENEYKLMPGHTYVKDPTITVKAGSEACYLYVIVWNDIADIEDSENTIEAQMQENGWLSLEEEDARFGGVYYKAIDKETVADTEYVIFESFTVAGNVASEELANYLDSSITIKAFAVQMDGFADAATAWRLSGLAYS